MKQYEADANMAHISDIRLVSLGEAWRQFSVKDHAIVYMMEGKAVCSSSLYNGVLSEGDMVVVPAGSGELALAPVSEPASAYCISFSSAVVSRVYDKWSIEDAAPSLRGMVRVRPIPVIRHRFDQLLRLWLANPGYTIQLHIGWLELWEAIRTGAIMEDCGLDTLLRDMIRHMDRHCEEPFQVEDMARHSGVTPSVFYKRFKEYTSLSPLQYITRNRIEKARRLLAEKDANIRDIANAVGYPDVYYFSRIFKKAIGIPPYRYHQLLRRKIAVLNPPLFDDLAALGVPRDMLIPFWNRDEQKLQYKQFEPASAELLWLSRAKPELIVGADSAAPLYDKLAAIAPTKLFPFKPFSWREHLLQLAAILNVPEVADYWLYYYDRKAAAISERIHRRLGDQTVLAAVASDQGVRVCGANRRKIGRLLYGDLQLNAPTGTEGFAFADFGSMAALNEFKADHILLLEDRSVGRSTHTSVAGRVHHAPLFPWLHYSAIGHERSIEQALLYFSSE